MFELPKCLFFHLSKDDVTGVDPAVFRRYLREEDEDPENQENEVDELTAGGYNRCF